MNVTNMVQGNLALKLETPAEPTFTVVQGGRSGFQPLTVKPARNQQAVVTPRMPSPFPTLPTRPFAFSLAILFGRLPKNIQSKAFPRKRLPT